MPCSSLVIYLFFTRPSLFRPSQGNTREHTVGGGPVVPLDQGRGLVVAEKKRMEDGERRAVSRSVTGTAFTQDGAGPRPRGLDLTSQGHGIRLPTVRALAAPGGGSRQLRRPGKLTLICGLLIF